MLLNTALTKPSPSAVCHDAAGNAFTGIIAAHVTSDNRKMLPLSAPGNRFHVGLRHGAVTMIAAHTARPITGQWSSMSGALTLNNTFTPNAVSRMIATIAT